MAFGRQVERALEQRKQQLIAHGLAKGCDDRAIQYQPDLLATLQGRELDRVGERADRHDLRPARDGSLVRGIYRRALTLASGKFAVIQREQHFTLVPWRALLERHHGREVVGIVRGMGVSWQLGMQRDGGPPR